jgi:hypothetical protein
VQPNQKHRSPAAAPPKVVPLAPDLVGRRRELDALTMLICARLGRRGTH